MPGQIREARRGDEDGLYALVTQLGHALPPVREAFDATIASYFAGDHPSVYLLVVDDGGELKGYALTTVVPLLATNGPSAQLQEIVVDADARGHDYGTQLVRAV
ncbi:MAG: GNAT family N-acetyltransferase [Pseudolysinimonas sp.]